MDLCAPGWGREPAGRASTGASTVTRMDTPRTDSFGATWSTTFSGAVTDRDDGPYRAIALPTRRDLEGGSLWQFPSTANT
jgi:hypothetical protein